MSLNKRSLGQESKAGEVVRGGRTQDQLPKRSMGRESYAGVVKRGGSSQDQMPTVKVHSIGNAHAWNISMFREIEKYWGEVLTVDDDTANCVRCDVGKIKVFTQTASVINNQMRLVVSGMSFVIRVAEEQAVFICSSNFCCQCACHGKEDEQARLADLIEDDDDVEIGGRDRDSQIRYDSWHSFIADTQQEGVRERVGIRGSMSLGEEEIMRGSSQLEVLNMNRGLVACASGLESQPSSDMIMRGLREDGDVNNQMMVDKDVNSQLALCGTEQVSGHIFGPDSQRILRYLSGPVFNVEGINLEVVLGSGDKEKCFNNSLIRAGTTRKDLDTVERVSSASVREQPDNYDNQPIQSLGLTDQRRSAVAGSSETRTSSPVNKGGGDLEILQPVLDNEERPRKRGGFVEILSPRTKKRNDVNVTKSSNEPLSEWIKKAKKGEDGSDISTPIQKKVAQPERGRSSRRVDSSVEKQKKEKKESEKKAKPPRASVCSESSESKGEILPCLPSE
ncbi:hypothetical protein Dimus_007305 [Dionaea muscipula]